MARSPRDYPLSAFREGATSAFGRVTSFAIACVAGPYFTFLAFLAASWFVSSGAEAGGGGPHGSVDWKFVLFLPLPFLYQLVEGFVHGWGVILDVVLAALFLAHVYWEARPSFTLPAVVLAVSADFFRCTAQSSAAPESKPAAAAVFLTVWAICLAGLVAYWLVASGFIGAPRGRNSRRERPAGSAGP